MLALAADPANWLALLTLTAMEIVLGIDNIVFISVLVSRLPKHMADNARRVGLALALIFRILLLLVLTWLIGLTQPVSSGFGLDLSWKDLILVGGGAFLIYKATREMHHAVENGGDEHAPPPKGSFTAIIIQIILIDMVFSVDSIVTAIGMAQHVEVMILAVLIAVGIMYVASGTVAAFIARHPTTKMLALAFLLLIGVTLVADGFGLHIDKAYIYAAMAFSTAVEAVNIWARSRRTGGKGRDKLSPALPEATVAEAAAVPQTRSRPRSTPASRAQSRPKSAPRRKPKP
jgi:predicted tellurium resistance membrane protein TerC